MKKTETAKLLTTLFAHFPRQGEVTPDVIEAYHITLYDLDFEVAMLALTRCLRVSKQWAPTVGEIREAALDVQAPEERLPTPSQAWAISEPHKTHCSGVRPDISTVPPIIKRAWKGLPTLGQDATMKEESFLRRDFIEAYKEELKRTRIKLLTPPDEQKRIDQIQGAKYPPLELPKETQKAIAQELSKKEIRGSKSLQTLTNNQTTTQAGNKK